VKFGMTKDEIGKKWMPSAAASMPSPPPAIKQVKPAFDHGRLYEFTFSIDLQFPDDPVGLVNIAFQELLNEKWKKKDAGLFEPATVRRNQVILNEHERRHPAPAGKLEPSSSPDGTGDRTAAADWGCAGRWPACDRALARCCSPAPSLPRSRRTCGTRFSPSGASGSSVSTSGFRSFFLSCS
jgi:hypothetical protein